MWFGRGRFEFYYPKPLSIYIYIYIYIPHEAAEMHFYRAAHANPSRLFVRDECGGNTQT